MTNCGPRAIVLRRVQVQAAVNGAWKTLAEKQPEIPLVLEAGSFSLSPALERGEHRRIVVPWPEERRWRVCVFYVAEHEGLNALAAKARVALRTGSLSYWRGKAWGGSERVAIKEVAR